MSSEDLQTDMVHDFRGIGAGVAKVHSCKGKIFGPSQRATRERRNFLSILLANLSESAK